MNNPNTIHNTQHTTKMAEPPEQPFRLVKSERGGTKLTENGYKYGMQRRVGEMIHWQCERRGV